MGYVSILWQNGDLFSGYYDDDRELWVGATNENHRAVTFGQFDYHGIKP